MPVKDSKVKSQKSKVAAVKSVTTKSSESRIKQASPKTVVEKVTKTTKNTSLNLSIPVYSLAGVSSGNLTLPEEIFGQKINKSLLAQAVRIYLTNQKNFTASTKTRGEVEGSTAKIFKQKGTGRARHGGIRAPIFVGGGIVFGPKNRKVKLDLPKKMKKAALFSALSSKVVNKNVLGLMGAEGASGKTKEVMGLLSKVVGKDKKMPSTLIITTNKMDNIARAVKNIPGIHALSASSINAHTVLRHELLLVTKEAIEKIGKKETI